MTDRAGYSSTDPTKCEVCSSERNHVCLYHEGWFDALDAVKEVIGRANAMNEIARVASGGRAMESLLAEIAKIVGAPYQEAKG